MNEPFQSLTARQLQYGYEGSHAYSPFYQHTGRVTFKGTALAVVAGLAAAVVLGFAYAYADLYIPIVQLNALLCLAFGAVIGAVAGGIMHWGKVRNLPVALTIVGVITLAAYYVCWVAWICGVWDRLVKVPRPFTYVELASRPRELWALILRINEVGTWSTSTAGSTTAKENEHGVMLWIIWAAEALGIFGGAFGVVKGLMSDRPFCERCDAWCSKAAPLLSAGAGDPAAIVQHLTAHDFPWLATLGPAKEPRWITLVHQGCATCNQLHAISAIEHKLTVSKKRQRTVKQKKLLNKLLVSAEELAALRGLAAAPSAPAAGTVPQAPPPPAASA